MKEDVIMQKRLIRWLLPLIVILVIATVMILNVSLSMAHATSPVRPGNSVPASVWHD